MRDTPTITMQPLVSVCCNYNGTSLIRDPEMKCFDFHVTGKSSWTRPPSAKKTTPTNSLTHQNGQCNNPLEVHVLYIGCLLCSYT